jgi:hypothetical protein
MPLNPPPVIEDQLGLVSQLLKRSDMSRPAEVTFALNCLDGHGFAIAQDVIDDFQANFNTNLKPLFDTEVTLEPPTIRLGDGTDTPAIATAAGAAVAGTNAGTMVNPAGAVLLKKTTGLGGRHNRGRTYFPFCIDNTLISENGTLDPALVASFNAQALLFLNQLTTDNSPMVIANKTFNTPLPPHFVTLISASSLVVSWKTESLVATQRRRLDR